MRAIVVCTLLALGCTDPFTTAQKADTIEAFEKYLAENPTGRHAFKAQTRLEELTLEKARKDKTLESYDTYLAKYPKGALREKAVEERRTFLFEWADATDTPEAWQKYIDEYPTGDKKKLVEAKRRLRTTQSRDKVEIGLPEMEQVNLAEDPNGPLNGWGFFSDVKNLGDKPLSKAVIRIQFLDETGNPAGEEEWPVVAEEFPTPIEEEKKVPMKPGETRRWDFTTGDLPAGWSKKVKLALVDIAWAGESSD